MPEGSGKLFQHLAIWDDAEVREGPEQMACDEALLGEVEVPVIRVFRWYRPWVSAGYFTRMSLAKSVRPDLPACRRWTGGGVVVHDGDFTFSLAVPSNEKLASVRASQSYQQIHLALATALRQHGIEAGLSTGTAGQNGECFAGAVENDLVVGGTKVAGGAQRRTRIGLLYQGSIQGVPAMGRDFGATVAKALAHRVSDWQPPRDFEEGVATLTKAKYNTPEFLRGPREANDFTRAAAS